MPNTVLIFILTAVYILHTKAQNVTIAAVANITLSSIEPTGVTSTSFNPEQSHDSTTESSTVPSEEISHNNASVQTEVIQKFDTPWECPNFTKKNVECSCDFPHTLRCTGDRTALQTINQHLKSSREGAISLLDLTVTGISTLPAKFLEDVALHGLVISTGELRRVNDNAFTGLVRPLQALGLPNNLLESVPTSALAQLNGLDRLDLSQNKLHTLEANSLKSLASLTYLDLSDNLLSQLSPQAFGPLKQLRSLKMRGNRLSVSALSALRGLKNLEELDLSSNLLIGPLGPNLLPSMPKLRFLTLSENELINVEQGALAGLKNLTYLSLSHNQIDVLEDHSFKYLSTLTRLDLASNRIVAVSSASLAHLENLVTLDLTHNFLRSLTADLVVPLTSLQDLRLDDNDITMVSSEVPTSKLKLKRLSLADNPLNCDCTLLDFANWLSNSPLDEEEKNSAVCATPPALENGILTQVSPGSLLCGDPTPPIMTKVPLARDQLTLKEFHYDKSGVNILWNVEPCSESYTCDSLIVYEATGNSEVEIESKTLHCDSRFMANPCTLPVTIPTSVNLQVGRKYRYCIVLLVPSEQGNLSLGLGCSDIIPLEETPKWTNRDAQNIAPSPPTTFPSTTVPSIRQDSHRITGVHVNVSEQGFLHVDISLSSIESSNSACELFVVVFAGEAALHRRKLNCTLAYAEMTGLIPGRYKVCASLNNYDEGHENNSGSSRCVEVQAFKQKIDLIILIAVVVSCALFVTIIMFIRNLIKKIKTPQIQTQCFLPAQELEITHKAHYIKLLATTKV
ncbi:slit homolog 2 protein [Microplitis demolitor]|uniref:slit homolog 2 protein n=1 Tax=Microplitis demolitor TaxID=69319 RepID=UPI0004CD796F|nr:slit homolog 2 protein [Microplitis demolitor]